MRILLTLSIIFTLLHSAYAEPEQTESIPQVFLNHFFLVLDSETYQDIEQSPFLKQEFAVFEKRTTTRSDTSYTGIYFYGRNTYFEFFDAAVQRMGLTGYSGVAFGVDKAGELKHLQTILAESYKTFPGDVTRGLNNIQVPWFKRLSTNAIAPNPTFRSWIMEYASHFLEEWHTDKPPVEAGVSRRSILQRYAAVLNSDPTDKLLVDVTGLTAAVPPVVIAGIKKLSASLGFKISEKDQTVLIHGPDLKLQLIPGTSSNRGIIQIEFRVQGISDQKEFRFGPKSILTFHSNTRATWKF